MNNGGIGGTILRPLRNVGPIWETPTILNNNYFPGTQCTSLELYFLCGNQALTCIPP